MAQDKVTPEITKALHQQGYFTRVTPAQRVRKKDPVTGKVYWTWLSEDEVGRPDMDILRGGYGVLAEFKNGKDSFAFSKLTAKQREEAVRYSVAPYCIPVFIILALGTDMPHVTKKPGAKPRKVWAVPYLKWLQIEFEITKHCQKSIPYRADRGKLKKLGLDAVTLLKEYEWVWVDGGWCIPENHIFAKHFKERNHVHASLFEYSDAV